MENYSIRRNGIGIVRFEETIELCKQKSKSLKINYRPEIWLAIYFQSLISHKHCDVSALLSDSVERKWVGPNLGNENPEPGESYS